VPELAARLDEADGEVAARDTDRTRAETAETDAERDCADLPDLAVLTAWRDAQERVAALRADLATRSEAAETAATDEERLGTDVTSAEQAVADAEDRARQIDREHRAAALAADLHEGEPCPVCHQVVGTLPHHDLAVDVEQARAATATARKTLTTATKRHAEAAKRAAVARTAVESAQQRLTESAAQLDGAPAAAELAEAITRRTAADTALTTARKTARAARTALDQATRQRAALAETEQRAWADLRAGRDRFVALSAPAVDGTDLAVAWQRLVDWGTAQRDELAERAAALDTAETELREQGKAESAGLVARLREHGVDVAGQPDKAPVELASHQARADRDVADLVARQSAATELAAEIAVYRHDQEVADLLGQLLRSNQFEAWLCTEALDSLVLEASQTLLQLSGGQYELFRGDRNDLVVVDHNDAGTHRPVNTLSGGETFQASLALALALSRQVVGLSGGKRDLNSMFLDEGFGTLDEATLDTVAVTLERLAQETDRMVGIVTHVPALAERVPVQFAVRRQGASSTVSRVDV
jgi:exonuclease SbcC